MAKDDLLDITVLHQIGLQRFSTTVLQRIQAVLDRVGLDIESRVKASALTDGDRPSASSQRLRRMLEQVQATQLEAYRAIRGRLEEDWSDLASAETAFTNRLGIAGAAIKSSANFVTVSAEQLRAAVMSQPFQGKVLREWTDQFEAGARARMRAAITDGYLQGEAVTKIARRVRLTNDISKRGAEALVRTSVNHFNAEAVRQSAAANPDLFPRYQWMSVLDNRTTPICQSRAGKVYRHGAGPMPPAHVRCRSVVINLVEGVGPYEDLRYGDWLDRQSSEVQQEVLGKTRFTMYQSGNIRFEAFTDQLGRRYTLGELRAKDSEAFRRAGL